MAFKIFDRVQETTTTTGTGTVTLAGAASGYRTFTSVLSNGDTCPYLIVSGTSWEVGIGTFTTSGTTLARTTIKASSNAGSAITLSGTSTVALSLITDKIFLSPLTTTGDIIYSSSGTTPARLGIGSTGQVLTVVSGVPNWASAAPPCPQYSIMEDWVGFDAAGTRTTHVKSASAILAEASTGLDLSTGSSASGYAYVQLNFQSYIGANRTAIFSSVIDPTNDGASSSSSSFWVGVGQCTTNGTSIDYTGYHMGFKLIRTGVQTYSLYATVGDGSAETATLLASGLDASTKYDVCCRWNQGNSVDFWYASSNSAWSSVTTISSGLPTLLLQSTLMAGISNLTNAAIFRIRVPFVSLIAY